ncbi:DUF6233 domain-containing protein [Streptomyces sp. NPDC018029]|uniref:DUF6233 domain-containing protein n=1 Tax=Streptomyces sp. NPDC018029 TaxID=3365032 RepID=UPI0037B456E6
MAHRAGHRRPEAPGVRAHRQLPYGARPAEGRSATREQAWRALAVDRVDACPHCRPDTPLGVLE